MWHHKRIYVEEVLLVSFSCKAGILKSVSYVNILDMYL